ncbi:MAG: hypothetical protein KGJ02_02230 [Verrucomicrobiota bacterium]|nr:hypothetical protein [Verrucomicrobiota bacterium]
MKITRHLLSLPPYLSTPWENVAALNAVPIGSTFTLIVSLENRSQVEIPGLDASAIQAIFDAHAQFLESQKTARLGDSPISFTLPFKLEGGTTPLSEVLQHNASQADLPPLPPNVLERITTIAKGFGLEDTSTLSPAEENCNCMYCQIIRALNDETPKEKEEEISNEDLSFRDWEVSQSGDQLYTVTHPLDKNEQYSVFLGTPLGCTCGQKSCEHLRAVLRT